MLTPDGSPAVIKTVSGTISLGVTAPTASTRSSSYTLNICPSIQTSSTRTSGGAIGWMISGAAMFNAFEADNVTVAMADNVSYSFKDVNGVAQTASFLDACNGHQTPRPSLQYHYHSWSPCLMQAAGDTASGPSHLIGVANDGFPIYSDRDANGKQVDVSALDECNGISSPTPEFPAGVYHYVLPSSTAVNTAQAAPRCLKGKVSTSLTVAIAQSAAICVAPSRVPVTRLALAATPVLRRTRS